MSDEEILNLRKRVDQIDTKIMGLLKKRFRIAKRIQEVKKRKNIGTEDKIREKQIKGRYVGEGFSRRFVDDFFGLLFRKAKEEYV